MDGHYHLFRVINDLNETQANNTISTPITLDIADTLVEVSYKTNLISLGHIDLIGMNIRLKLAHSFEDFEILNIENGDVYAKSRDIAIILRKVINTPRDQELDYLAEDRISLSLPTIYENDSLIYRDVSSWVFPIVIGKPRNEYVSDFGRKKVMVLGDKIVPYKSKTDLELYQEQAEVKLPERLRKVLKPLIITDSNLMEEVISDFKFYYKKKGIDSLAVAYKLIKNESTVLIRERTFSTYNSFENIRINSYTNSEITDTYNRIKNILTSKFHYKYLSLSKHLEEIMTFQELLIFERLAGEDEKEEIINNLLLGIYKYQLYRANQGYVISGENEELSSILLREYFKKYDLVGRDFITSGIAYSLIEENKMKGKYDVELYKEVQEKIEILLNN